MTKALIQKIKDLPRLKLLVIVFVVWQYICVAGIGILGWPNYLVAEFGPAFGFYCAVSGL